MRLSVLALAAAACLVGAQSCGTARKVSIDPATYTQMQADSLRFIGADWHWTDLGDGAQAGWTRIELFGAPQSISVIRYPMKAFRTDVLERDGRDAKATSKIAKDYGATIAVNGSYFDTKEYHAVTFVKQDGQVLYDFGATGLLHDGIVTVRGKSDDSVRIRPSAGKDNATLVKSCSDALASGPLLLQDGKPFGNVMTRGGGHSTNRHPRTVVGMSRPGVATVGGLQYRDATGKVQVPDCEMVYFIVVDGRFPTLAYGASVPELVLMCRWMGLSDALNLDGGGSSTLWSKKTGVISHPCDNRMFDATGERRVPNIIAVTPLRGK